MAAGQDHSHEQAVRGVISNPLVTHVAGMDFAKDMGFAHPARDQLRDLRAEVEDENFLMHGVDYVNVLKPSSLGARRHTFVIARP